MKHSTLVVSLLALALLGAGCRTPGYTLPVDGAVAADPSGTLQISATKAPKVTKKGYDVTLDVVNNSDTGILLPLSEMEAAIGGQLGALDLDVKRLRKRFQVVSLRLFGTTETGLFANTAWVTGAVDPSAVTISPMPVGDAIFVQPRSRLQEFDIACSLANAPGGDLTFTVRRVFTGDATGLVSTVFTNQFQWRLAQQVTTSE